MNGKKGNSIRIDIGLPSSAVPRETARKSGSGEGDEAITIPLRKWMMEVWQFAREDTNRVTFSLKVGLACLLVSLLILLRAPYQVFGANIIWSILTVAIMFEYTVGATFNRGFNRALGSLLAGVFAVVVIQVAMSSGHVAEPYVIGLSIFLVGSITSFMKLWPSLVPYEYGFRVILFTYCLIIVSGYRMGNPIRTAMDRLYSIAIGAIVAVLVNVLIFPIWAGEQLHRELVGHFDSVADSLEECVKKYLSDDGSDHPEFAKTVMDDFQDEPAFRKCRSTLNSSAKLDSLANSAKWEPPHGRFMQMFYPWAEYVKVGAVLRHCAYEVMALHGCLHSEIQAPYNLRYTFRTEILDATNQAAELLRSLAKDLSNMKHSLHTSLLKRVHASTERLQRSIDLHSYLLTLSHDVCDCSTKPPAKLSHVSSLNGTDADGKKAEAETYHETMKKQQRRLHSWPSREVDDFEEDMSGESIPRMHALESTAALSLATFTSLLIEFVARLDHLVEAADELAKLAKAALLSSGQSKRYALIFSFRAEVITIRRRARLHPPMAGLLSSSFTALSAPTGPTLSYCPAPLPPTSFPARVVHRRNLSSGARISIRHRPRHLLVSGAAPATTELSSADEGKKLMSSESQRPVFPFSAIVGQDEMKLCLLLNVIDPKIGGVMIMGDRGTGKSTVVRSLVDLLPEIKVVVGDPFNSDPEDPESMSMDVRDRAARGEPLPVAATRITMVDLPLGATEDRVCGTIDIEKALTEGVKAFEPGLLAKANRGILYVDEVNLLDDHLVDVLLDSAASGWNTVEREGISISHPARFILIGSGNPEEGELRPQLLDRFGMHAQVGTVRDAELRVKIVEERAGFDQDPKGFRETYRAEQEKLQQQIASARSSLASVQIDHDLRVKISKVCAELNVDGLRGDIVSNRAAKALAALKGRDKVTAEDIATVIPNCLRHRLRKDPLESIDSGLLVIEKFYEVFS
ncbi:unnamed protein product [Musa banksii]